MTVNTVMDFSDHKLLLSWIFFLFFLFSGGSSKCVMFINICPNDVHFSESLSSLQFGQRVNKIELGQAKKRVRRMSAPNLIRAGTTNHHTGFDSPIHNRSSRDRDRSRERRNSKAENGHGGQNSNGHQNGGRRKKDRRNSLQPRRKTYLFDF